MQVGEEVSFDDLAPLDSEQVETNPFDLVASWRDRFEFTSVCALHGIPDTNLAAFGEDVVNSYL